MPHFQAQSDENTALLYEIRSIVRDELHFMSERNRIAYTIQDASRVVGTSESVIRAAIKRGDLAARYPSSRPIIEASELRTWVEHLPSERGSK